MDRNLSTVSVDEVIARGTPVHWDEAVAIIEEMCHALIAASGDEARVPALSDVLIDSRGTVTAQRSRGEKSPSAAGRCLHMLLANADVPPPLRLFVTQSIAPETHASLREFARGLSYFGKPDRTQMIQDVYARCAELIQFGAEARPVPPIPDLETPPQDETPASKRRGRRAVRWALAAACLIVAVGAGWLVIGGESREAVQGNAARLYSQAAAAIADVGKQVRETLAPSVESAQADTPVSAPRASRSVAAAVVDVAPAPITARRVATAPRQVLQLAAAMPAVAKAEPAAASIEALREDATLYSVADSDVEPPVLLHPHVRPAAAAPGAQGGTNTMAVIVAPDGTVERVQLVDGPTRMPDMMLLSGAKTWRFAPATKDGEPVRYRTVLTWAGLP